MDLSGFGTKLYIHNKDQKVISSHWHCWNVGNPCTGSNTQAQFTLQNQIQTDRFSYSSFQIYLNFSSKLPAASGPREESSSHVHRLNSVGSHSTITQPLLSSNNIFIEGTSPRHPPVWLSHRTHLLRHGWESLHNSCLAYSTEDWKTLIIHPRAVISLHSLVLHLVYMRLSAR